MSHTTAPRTPVAGPEADAASGAPYGSGYYREHLGDLPARLQRAVPRETLRDLHARSGWRHLGVVVRHLALFAACAWVGVTQTNPWLWVPAAFVQGTVLLGFVILLHDTIHESVFVRRRPVATRLLGLAYALPTAISASQFRRWHLDHHRELGSVTADPKRAHLSPKRNARWLKLLYLTPALFVIYARAAACAARGYEPALRRTIRTERVANVLLHLAVAAALWWWIDGAAALRAYVVPLFVFFPAAFTVNRLGQHYWVDSADPAKWGTRVDGSPLVNFLFLNSNYHVEHHYFPSVPLYRLPSLNRSLRGFWKEIGHPNRSYPRLLWGWFVRNERAHTDWH